MARATEQPSPEVQQVIDFIDKIRRRLGTVVVGQDVVVERLLIALFTSGHLLLQGVPGLAKTLLVSALSKTIDLEFSRIQFTIDLLPSDILGSEILGAMPGVHLIARKPEVPEYQFVVGKLLLQQAFEITRVLHPVGQGVPEDDDVIALFEFEWCGG